MANDLPPLPNDLIEAIGAYWDTGYEEGKCGIGGDSANECLAAVYERVRDFARAAVQAEREACAQLCDQQHDRARTSPGAARADACARPIRARSTP